MAIGKGAKKNRSDYNEASPYGHFKPTEKSGHEGIGNPRGVNKPFKGATPYGHFKPTKKSGGEGIGDPQGVGKAERKTAYEHFEPTPLSGPEAPRAPKSWKKRGYDRGNV